MKNPYPKHPGFAGRVAYAQSQLCQLAQDPYADTLTRAFDNCFENGDGDAVAFALMSRAAQNPLLLRGIQQLHGGQVPPSWLAIFNMDADQRSLF